MVKKQSIISKFISSKNDHEFQKIDLSIEKNNYISMCISIVLVIFGCFGNILSFIIFVYSNKKLPKITSSKFLILLTIVNTIYLLVHFYIETVNQIIYIFDLKNEENIFVKIYHFDTNSYVCKLFSYLKYCGRYLNVMLTLSFSLERTFAIYYPFQMRIRNIKNTPIFKGSIILSFILPVYLLKLIDVFPTIDSNNSTLANFTPNFNLRSLRPTFQEYFCTVAEKDVKLLFKLHAATFLFILLAYILVSLSILAIIVKLRRQEQFKFSYRSKSSSHKSSLHSESFIKSRITNNSFRVCKKETRGRRQKKVNLFINQKFHNTKMLLSISASFVCFNFPYFFGMLLMFLFTKDVIAQNENNLISKLKIKAYLNMFELLQLANFSITGFLFYLTGRIFRLHFFVLLRGLFKGSFK